MSDDQALTVQQPTPSALIAMAIDKGMTPDHLERLFNMQERHERNAAGLRFGDAMAAFQRDCPAVFKGRAGARGNYASYEDVMLVAKPWLSKHGISISFEVDTGSEGRMQIGVRIQVGAHAEDRTFPFLVPADLKANDSQRFGAALTYAKRHALCSALNIVVTDQREDNDADEVDEFVTPTQAKHLHVLMEEAEANRTKFFAWASTANGSDVATLDEMPQRLYQQAETLLRSKIAQRKKEGGAA